MRYRATILTMVLLSAGTFVTYHQSEVSGRRDALALYRLEWDSRVAADQHRFEGALNMTYQAIRTMAVLPGVRNIDRHGRNFEGDPKTTVQQIYNNVASHVPLSEIYIVPADLDPDQLDPITGKLQEPITTFDEIIAGNSADEVRKTAHTQSSLEEVEIFEYREMKAQNQYFQSRYGNLSTISDQDYPAICSRDLVTCDNTEFSKADLSSGNEEPRSGVVYSVPFYGADGRYKGMISAVMRTRALSRLITHNHIAVHRASTDYKIGDTTVCAAADEEPKPYSKQVACKVVDNAPWTMTASVPGSEFEVFPAYRSVHMRGKLIVLSGGLLTLAMSAFVWSLSATRYRAQSMATAMTRDLAIAKDAAESALREVSILRAALDQNAILSIADQSGRILDANSGFCEISGYSRVELIGQDHRIVNSGVHSRSFWSDVWRQIASGKSWRGEVCNRSKSGDLYWVDTTIIPYCNSQGGIEKYVSIRFDITARKNAEAERDKLQAELEDASRQAGMAEIATGVLHNVGNVLNTVNVSATVIADKLKTSKVSGLSKAAAMIQERGSALGQFISEDPRGMKLPAFLCELSNALTKENNQLIDEVSQLFRSVEHMTQVIHSQQTFAMRGLNPEPLNLGDVIEEAISLNLVSMDKHNIDLIREFRPSPKGFTEKHRVMQILINLISNAKKAIMHPDASGRKIRFCMHPTTHDGIPAIAIQVIDSGVGIEASDLPKIFQHGFTRSKGGHGFGLHTCAIDAGRMGGKLTVESAGLGRGATFTLIIPAATEVAKT